MKYLFNVIHIAAVSTLHVMLTHIYIGVSVYWPECDVSLCVCVCVCVCVHARARVFVCVMTNQSTSQNQFAC